ncbi:putative mlx-interacting protein [Erysiphe necator]|uniref:Putative mlx-interacting protein n=1 Tax=Uncinula necator TaxID=52586 RepID=A0A0B1PAS9_UNCNE|nr:putative mlx-interacting protein [Erysiphe necator]
MSKSPTGEDLNIIVPSIEEKPRLSENEKKANHIASEQKRRQAIREGFDRLTELVPGLEGQGRSESVVLKKTVDYIRAQLAERQRLVNRIEELGGQQELDINN